MSFDDRSASRMQSACGGLLLLACIACGLSKPIALGTRLGDAIVQREIMIEFDDSLSNRILSLGSGEVDQLLLTTSEKAMWYSLSQEITREIAFSSPRALFPARSVNDSNGVLMGFIGMSRNACVQWLNSSGKPVGCYPSNPSGEFVAADIGGDADIEIIVESLDRKGITIYSLSGQPLNRIDLGGYLTALDTMDVDGDKKSEILTQMYPDRQGQGTYRIFHGDGNLVEEWHGTPVEDLEPVPWLAEIPTILTIEENALAMTRLQQDLDQQAISIPGIGYFRDLHAASLQSGHRVVVASGDGYRPYHMVAVLTAENTLIYQHFGRERAYGLTAPRWAGESFFVAIGNRVWRYNLTRRD